MAKFNFNRLEGMLAEYPEAFKQGNLEDQPISTGNNRCTNCGVSPRDKVDYCSIGRCYKDYQYELQNPGRIAD